MMVIVRIHGLSRRIRGNDSITKSSRRPPDERMMTARRLFHAARSRGTPQIPVLEMLKDRTLFCLLVEQGDKMRIPCVGEFSASGFVDVGAVDIIAVRAVEGSGSFGQGDLGL